MLVESGLRVSAAAGAVTPWTAAGFVWAFLTPRFASIYSDFDVALPVTARWMISAHEGLASVHPVAPGIVVTLGVLVLFVLLVLTRAWVCMIAGVLGLVALLGVLLSNFAVLVKLIESLQGA